MHRKLLYIAMLLVMAVTQTVAQTDPIYRREIGGGIGVTNYIGDFNGSLTKNFQPEVTLLYRRNLSPWQGFKVDASWTTLKGNSKDVTTYYPDYQTEHYSFSNTMIDLNVCYEYNFWPYGTGYDYRGAKPLVPFVFIGLGATVATGNGTTAATANLPIGLGMKYKMSERVNLGVEWGMHFSLSDKLDGIKDPYYVQSSGIFKNTDCYSSLRVTLTYSFSAKCPTCNKDDW